MKVVDVDSNDIKKEQTIETPQVSEMKKDDYAKMSVIESLPSKGRYYKNSLYGRPLDLQEIKKLSNISIINFNQIMYDIITSATSGIPIKDILVGDELFIILWLRANTYPQNGYSIDFECDNCGKESHYDFKVDNIEVNYISDNNIDEPVKMQNGDIINLKYPTIGDKISINKLKEMTKKSSTKYENDDLILSIAIESINDKITNLVEKYDYIRTLKPYEYSYLTGYMNKFDFGINDKLTVKCNKCGGTAQTGLTFRREFLMPTYRFEPDTGTTV